MYNIEGYHKNLFHNNNNKTNSHCVTSILTIPTLIVNNWAVVSFIIYEFYCIIIKKEAEKY
jgi:hypothetical protein